MESEDSKGIRSRFYQKIFSIEMINPNTLPRWVMCSDYHCLVREAGLEPARAYCTLEPESSESANSTTRAYQIVSTEEGGPSSVESGSG